MPTNNRSLEKDRENDFGRRPTIATEIYELCRLLSEQGKAIDGSCSENISDISHREPPNVNQFSKQKIKKTSSAVKIESTSTLNSIPFDKQKRTNPLVSVHSEPLSWSLHPDVKNSDSPLPFESNTSENERIQRNKEFLRIAVHEHSNDKSNAVVPMENDVKTIPFFPVPHRQFETQVREKLNHLANRRSIETNPSNNINIRYKTVLNNDQFSSGLKLQSEDLFPAPKSQNVMQRSIFNSNKNLTGLGEIFQGCRAHTVKQKPFLFNYTDSSDKEYRKDNSFYKTFLCNTDTIMKQCEELKFKRDQILQSTKIESKLLAFNISLRLENQRKLKDDDTNLNQMKVSRRLSAPAIAGFINKTDGNCILVQTAWLGRKCKSEVQIQQENKTKTGTKFLVDKISKDTHLDSNSSNLPKSLAMEETSKVKGIPTFRGHILPAKVSVLLLNGPIRLNYTENISGKSREILMCTSDVIEEVTRSENDIKQQDVIKRILAISRPYIGKPVHIFFEPTKATDLPSSDDSVEGNPASLHPSPAKHNLLSEESEDSSSTVNQANDETDADMTWENSSDVTIVVKQSDQLKEIENRMPRTDPSGLDSSAQQNNRLAASGCTRSVALQVKKKLKIRLCRRKKSRTALKRVNVKQIVNSAFSNFFHFYSVVRGHLKSGSVITKSNSILWMREAGVATDARSMEMASQLFKDFAGAKVVLNIFDYMQFLNSFARRQRMATVDLIRQLTICELPKASKIQHRQNSESRRLKMLHQSKRSEEGRTETVSAHRSQSLPNLKTASPVLNR